MTPLESLAGLLASMSDRDLLLSVDAIVLEASSRGLRGSVSQSAQRYSQNSTIHAVHGGPGVQVAVYGGPGHGSLPVEKTEYDVVLFGHEAGRFVDVVKAVRSEFPDLSLQEASSIIKGLDAHVTLNEEPYSMPAARGLSPLCAEDLVKKLRAAGADARMV